MKYPNPKTRLLIRQKPIYKYVVVVSSVLLFAGVMLFVFFNLTGKKDALSAGDNHLRSSLKSFSSSERKNKTELGWTTASEINNDHFLLERSADGMNYVLLGKVKGAGNSVHDMNYAFIDENPLNGNNYYRLTQVNFDGKSASYSPVVVKFNRQMEGD